MFEITVLPIAFSILVGLFTAILGFLTSFLARKKSEQEKFQKEQVSALSHTVIAQAEDLVTKCATIHPGIIA